jgi:transcriptional regulator with XRE-family HTH domain
VASRTHSRRFAGMSSRDILARNLRALRQTKDMSQEELAHQAGIDRTYVSDLERMIYAASVDMLDALARVLGVGADDLIDPDFSPDA